MNSFEYDYFDYISPLWKLADPLTVEQAAALIAGFDPNLIRYNAYGGVYFESETGSTDSNGSHGVQTAYSALKNAINGGKLKAKIVHDSRPVTDGDSQALFDMMGVVSFLPILAMRIWLAMKSIFPMVTLLRIIQAGIRS